MKYKFAAQHIILLAILIIFSVFSHDYAEYTLPLVALTLTVFYFIVSKTSCPSCHKFNAKHIVRQEVVECHSNYSEKDFDESDASFYTKKIHYKCKFCNYKWNIEKTISRH